MSKTPDTWRLDENYTFPAVASINGELVPGEFSFTPDKGVKFCFSSRERTSIGMTWECDELHCQFEDGTTFVMAHASASQLTWGSSSSQFTISASFAIIGNLSHPAAGRFASHSSLEFDGLEEWIGTNAFTLYPYKSDTELGGRLEVDEIVHDNYQFGFSCTRSRRSFCTRTVVSGSTTRRQLTRTSHQLVTITLQDLLTAEDLVREIHSVQLFLATVSGCVFPIKSIATGNPDDGNGLHMLLANNLHRSSDYARNRCLVFSAVKNAIPDAWIKWTLSSDVYIPSSEMLLAKEKLGIMDSEFRFLSVILALEGFHRGAFPEEVRMDRQKANDLRQRLRNFLDLEDLDNEARDVMLGLASHLAEPSFKNRFRSLILQLPDISRSWIGIDETILLRTIVDYRNFYAHRTALPSRTATLNLNLHGLTEVVRGILRAAMLRHLGFSENAVDASLKNSPTFRLALRHCPALVVETA